MANVERCHRGYHLTFSLQGRETALAPYSQLQSCANGYLILEFSLVLLETQKSSHLFHGLAEDDGLIFINDLEIAQYDLCCNNLSTPPSFHPAKTSAHANASGHATLARSVNEHQKTSPIFVLKSGDRAGEWNLHSIPLTPSGCDPPQSN